MPDSPEFLYTVQRRNWVRHDTAVVGDPERKRLIRLPGFVRLASFENEADALAECANLEEQTRRAVNPFACDGDGLHFQTSFDTDRLHDWLLDADITPPEAGEKGRDWLGWWEATRDSLSEMQWLHVWQALDRIVFHEVVSRPRKPVVYVIAQISWLYNDYSFDPRPEGGVPIKAYRSRARAEAERLALELEARDDYDEIERLEVDQLLDRQQPFRPCELECPDLEDPSYPLHYEVIEVELDALMGGAR
jgi:hypothetical protein